MYIKTIIIIIGLNVFLSVKGYTQKYSRRDTLYTPEKVFSVYNATNLLQFEETLLQRKASKEEKEILKQIIELGDSVIRADNPKTESEYKNTFETIGFLTQKKYNIIIRNEEFLIDGLDKKQHENELYLDCDLLTAIFSEMCEHNNISYTPALITNHAVLIINPTKKKPIIYDATMKTLFYSENELKRVREFKMTDKLIKLGNEMFYCAYVGLDDSKLKIHYLTNAIRKNPKVEIFRKSRKEAYHRP